MGFFFQYSSRSQHLFFILMLLSATTLSFHREKPEKGQWKYCDGYTFKYLQLNKDGTFLWNSKNCRQPDQLWEGAYEFHGDTILLFDQKTKDTKTILRRKNTLFSYQGTDNEFPNFQPLTRTRHQTLEAARNQCHNRRGKRIN